MGPWANQRGATESGMALIGQACLLETLVQYISVHDVVVASKAHRSYGVNRQTCWLHNTAICSHRHAHTRTLTQYHNSKKAYRSHPLCRSANSSSTRALTSLNCVVIKFSRTMVCVCAHVCTCLISIPDFPCTPNSPPFVCSGESHVTLP